MLVYDSLREMVSFVQMCEHDFWWEVSLPDIPLFLLLDATSCRKSSSKSFSLYFLYFSSPILLHAPELKRIYGLGVMMLAGMGATLFAALQEELCCGW